MVKNKKYLHIEIETELLKALKTKAIEQDITLKQYVTDKLKADYTKPIREQEYIIES